MATRVVSLLLCVRCFCMDILVDIFVGPTGQVNADIVLHVSEHMLVDDVAKFCW